MSDHQGTGPATPRGEGPAPATRRPPSRWDEWKRNADAGVYGPEGNIALFVVDGLAGLLRWLRRPRGAKHAMTDGTSDGTA